MKQFDAPSKTLAGLDPELAATLIAAAADVVLVVDSGGVIRDIAFGSDELSDRIGMYLDLAESRHSDPLALTQALITYHLLRAAHAGGGRDTRWLS